MSSPPGPDVQAVKSQSPPGSRTASPARSLRNRMGTMMRRTSTGITNLSKPSSLLRSQSKSSLKVETTPTPAASPDPSIPSPVVESPAREAAAENSPVAAPALGPSPLSNSTTAADSAAVELGPPAPVFEAAVVSTSPEPLTVPLTEEPQSTIVSDVNKSTDAQAEGVRFAEEAPTAPAQPEPANIIAAADVSGVQEPQPAVVTVPQEPLVEKRGPDYFAWGDEHALAPKWSESSLSREDATARSAEHVPAVIAATSHGSTEPTPPRTDDADAFAWKTEITLSPKASSSSFATDSNRARESSLPPRSGRVSTKPSKSSMASSYGQVIISTAGKQVSVSMDPNEGEARRGRSPGPSVRISVDEAYSDPFADPPVEPPAKLKKFALSPIESVNSPLPDPQSQDPAWSAPISFPLPPQRDVIASKSIRDMPSAYSLGERPTMTDEGEVQHVTDERLPLLQRSASAGFSGNGKAAAQQISISQGAVPFPVSEVVQGPAAAHSIEALGWTEHILPDSSFYYFHDMLRVVTDIDLRNAKKLSAVTEYLDRKHPQEFRSPPQGWELWLRDASSSNKDFKPVRNWVNHKARILSFDLPPTLSDDALPDHITDDDRLDMEYRYWTFLECHPAHTPLKAESRAEALDALTWSYTDCLLPSSGRVPPPFTTQECQELMGLLRSIDNTSQSTTQVQARIVARVLMRVAQWRQHYYRPNKPLPQDTSKGPRLPRRRIPFHRAVTDFLISCLCLGLPYLFLDRSRSQRIDEESGMRSAGPMLMIGACACLVAAVILSASVTFISLSGLDDISRLAGLLAILFSASSMVSAVIALFRYKADVERTVVHVGGEGLMLLTRRSIVMSLPLVFLAWAIAAFITGVTFYSFRGTTMTGRIVIKHPFEDYTHWSVVGTLGGLAGLLIVSALLSRR